MLPEVLALLARPIGAHAPDEKQIDRHKGLRSVSERRGGAVSGWLEQVNANARPANDWGRSLISSDSHSFTYCGSSQICTMSKVLPVARYM
jgi:hypothetical protein